MFMWYGDRVNYNLATKAGTSKKKKSLDNQSKTIYRTVNG